MLGISQNAEYFCLSYIILLISRGKKQEIKRVRMTRERRRVGSVADFTDDDVVIATRHMWEWQLLGLEAYLP